jgi:hypothetical protein
MSLTDDLGAALAAFVDDRIPAPAEAVAPPAEAVARVFPPELGPHADALEALPDGALIGGTWLVDRTVTVKSITGPATITATGAFTILEVSAQSVRHEALAVVGSGSSPYSGSAHGVHVTGDDYRAVDCSITAIPGSGLWADDCDDLLLERVRITDFHYAGVMMLGVVGARIVWCDIRDAVGSGTDSYGVAASMDANAGGRRSEHMYIAHNRISGIPWEGLDTHGGRDIRFHANDLSDVGLGVAAVGARTGDVYTHAPQDVQITGNRITQQNTSRYVSDGIRLVGCATGGAVTEYATGRISGNIVRGFGAPDRANSGAVTTYNSWLVRISDNEMDTPAGQGILLQANTQYANVTGNVVVDPWSSTAANKPSGVAAIGTRIKALVTDNMFGAGAKSGSTARRYGVYADASVNNVLKARDNFTDSYAVFAEGII